MSVVKVNVLSVPTERREVLEQRFAARAGEVDTTAGFESFELLRPTDDSDRYFVVTRWSTEQAFEDWMASRAFQRGHATEPVDTTMSPPNDATQPRVPSPAASQAELLSFEVVQESRA